MKDPIEILANVAENVGGEWKQKALMESPRNNPYVEAYNDGVSDMAAIIVRYLSAIIIANGGGNNG